MQPAYARAMTLQAATDHGRPVASYSGIALVDVRAEFPDLATFRRRDRALVQFVSQHHDAGQYDARDDTGHALDADATFSHEMLRIAAVHKQHALTNGWPGIGYHTYGFPSGRLYLVGDLDTQRANVARRNHQSIGHCSAGDFTDAPPPVATQLVAAMATIAAWAHLGRLAAILSHHDAALPSDPTECCGATRDQWVPRLPAAIIAIAQQLLRTNGR